MATIIEPVGRVARGEMVSGGFPVSTRYR
jgi:hypothetical protein